MTSGDTFLEPPQSKRPKLLAPSSLLTGSTSSLSHADGKVSEKRVQNMYLPRRDREIHSLSENPGKWHTSIA